MFTCDELDKWLETQPKTKTLSCGHEQDIFSKEAGYTINEEFVCQDCYFEKLGEIVESHPIGRPMPHGGCVVGD